MEQIEIGRHHPGRVMDRSILVWNSGKSSDR